MKRQGGMSLIGLLLTGVAFAAVFLLGMKVVPAVAEYMAIQKVIRAIASTVDPNSVTVSEIRRDFDLRSTIDDIKTVSGADLEITKRAGKVDISVAYARRIPVVANVSLLIDFEARSAGN